MKVVCFGAFEVNVLTGETRKHGIHIKLQGQPYQILVMLLDRPGEVVTREEIRRRLWPSDTFVEFEDGVNSAVKKLRQVLGDSTDHPVYVETIPRVGYRFIAPLKPRAGAETQPAAADEPAAPEFALTPRVETTARTRWSSWRWSALGIICAVLVGSVVAFFWRSGKQPGTSASANERVILAVLPFANLTGDPSQDFFSDGMTEEMITQLGRLDPQRLRVIARTSVMGYKQTQEPMQQIGRELGAQYLLEGSVRRDSGTVRVSAQLIRSRDQTHVWARQYDRQMSGILALQGEIAQEIADEVLLTFRDRKSNNSVTRPSLSPEQSEVYDLYLKGLYFWNQRTGPGFQKAIVFFQQAITRDPNYAPAYAGLANSYALLTTYSLAAPNEYMPRARAAALRALELDPNLPEAHIALALIVQSYDYDWQTAEKEYKRAIELDPNYATAHHWYAEHLGFRGRFDEAFQESERARELDPLSLIIAVDNGTLLYYSRQYDRAIEKLQTVMQMAPDFPRTDFINAAYLEKGLYSEALAGTEKDRPLSGGTMWYWAWAAYAYGRMGRRAQAQSALEKLEELSRHQRVDPVFFAEAYMGLSRKERALAYLQKAFDEHSIGMATLKVDPVYDPLRSDPRFQSLLRRLGLAE